jgi:ABC-type multidrug transport system fused ATPase/permease subunit
LLDEATSNIDIVTEQKIQSMIKKEFEHCTVITIAHRLQTIIESDKVVVLGEGKVLEYDCPQTLMNDKTSYFSQLVGELKND